MNTNNNQTKFQKIIVDADRDLITSAKSVQEDYIVVKNKLTGIEKEFPNISTFKGLGKQVGGWLKETTDFLGYQVPLEDFEITYHSRLRADIENHLEEAKLQFSYLVGQIKQLPYADEYLLCIGGEGNFRYDIATILPYKGHRKEKPIIFERLKQEIVSQYKNKIKLANGMEADDLLGNYAFENQQHFRKTGKYKYLLAYIDKDLNQLWGPSVTLGKLSEDITYIDPLAACKNFCIQCLMGDQTDMIQGLKCLTDEIIEKYSLRKTKGCGEVSAKKIIDSSESIKECLERVVWCYKSCYGESWKPMFEENAKLLWMLRTPDVNWNPFKELLDKVGVRYD